MSDSSHASDVIKTLLESGADINAQTRGDEDTALHLVVENGDFPRDFSTVLVLLENGIDLSVRNREAAQYIANSLHIIAEFQKVTFTGFGRQVYQTEVSVRNPKLRTAYDCAIGKGHFELASTLDGSMPPEQARRFYTEKIGEKYGPYLISAVLKNDKAKLIEAVRLGGNPNMLNQHGAGAIHYAITHCTLPVMDVLEILADADADVNLRDYEGDSALNLAIKSKKLRESGQMLDVVRFLSNCGADPSFKDLDGKDAFDMAEERGYEDVLNILKGPRQSYKRKPPRIEPETPPHSEDTQPEEFPDPNAPNAEGLYPIHVAVLRQDPAERESLIESLISRGAVVSQTAQQTGNTALHMCAIHNLDDTATQLLGHRIDYTIKNKSWNAARRKQHMDLENSHPSLVLAVKRVVLVVTGVAKHLKFTIGSSCCLAVSQFVSLLRESRGRLRSMTPQGAKRKEVECVAHFQVLGTYRF
ncbi:hypothetical protein BaRGS_00023657 [Batillaria attramentaria]|uniref:Ankyrin n=1 Tax=Batillaria attramentaria TaxID=370345 RepID=A0ABD0KDQ0_9CAEN